MGDEGGLKGGLVIGKDARNTIRKVQSGGAKIFEK